MRVGRAAVLWVVSALAALSGCGGGDDAAASGGGADALTASTLTVAQYQAQRAGGAGGAVGAATQPDAAAQASLRSADLAMAPMPLESDLAAGNPVVLPPLTYAAARALAAAAQGDSLAQLTSVLAGRVDLTPGPMAAAWQTGRVTSAAWAAKDFKLARRFLTAIDSSDGRLAGWSMAEAGFADGNADADAGLTQALAASGANLSQLDRAAEIRLLLTHALRLTPAWPAGVSFDGLFESAPQQQWSVKLVRVSQGVRRFAAADYTADLIAAGDLRVLSLRPVAGDLKTFAAGRLGPALAESVQALVVDGGGAAGELLLPLGAIGLTANAAAPLAQAGVALVFDPVHANLRGLDETGGTYAQTRSAAGLTISTDGLTLSAAHAMAFTHSDVNVNGGDGGGGGVIVTNPCLGTQTWPTPDLRSLFVAVLDARGALLAIVGLQLPGGMAYVPPCVFGFPIIGG